MVKYEKHMHLVKSNKTSILLKLSEPGIARKVYLKLQCSKDWTMTDLAYVKSVTEVEKCVYQAELASSLFCGKLR